MMSRTLRPLARKENLLIQPTADEIVVYDTETDKAYVLSPSAAAVWKASNGKRTVQEIAAYLSKETPTNEDTVWYALGQMPELLHEPVNVPKEIAGISRRQFLQRAGLVAAAAAVPVVVTMMAPEAAQAQSPGGFGCQCVTGACGAVIPCGTPCIAFCGSPTNIAGCPAACN
jgi:hypothetical protein